MKTGSLRGYRAFVLFCLFFSFASAKSDAQHLVLIGGGNYPKPALEKLVHWSGDDEARLLLIGWASEEYQESFHTLRKLLARWNLHPKSIEEAPSAEAMGISREVFLSQLDRATGVFFTGGDQNRIMKVLKDKLLLQLLRRRYEAGVAFGGTSAGTAIMSNPMITGQGDFTVIDGTKVQTTLGLGLLPGAIIDQHFLMRKRENRLFGLLLLHPNFFGLGVDEDSAISVENNSLGEVLGPEKVMVVTVPATGEAELTLKLLSTGDLFDFKLQRKIGNRSELKDRSGFTGSRLSATH